MVHHEVARLLGDDIVRVEVLHAGEAPATLRFVALLLPIGDRVREQAGRVSEEHLFRGHRLIPFGAVHAARGAPGDRELIVELHEERDDRIVLAVVHRPVGRDDVTQATVVPPRSDLEEVDDQVERGIGIALDFALDQVD